MSEAINLSGKHLQIIDLVISKFINEKKPTSRRQLLLKFEDPDLLEVLITRSLLRDVDRQAVLPTLVAFRFYRDKSGVKLARESLQTVLHALRALYLDSEGDKQITPSEIETKAREIGRSVGQDTVWLGLYFVHNYLGVLRSSAGYSERGQLDWIVIDESILKLKDIDTVWETRMKQEIQWLVNRDSHHPADGFLRFDEDQDKFPMNPPLTGKKQTELLIFISHSSKDTDVAFDLIELLRTGLNLQDKHIRCTSVDGFRLPSGANTDDVLKAEVREAKAFIGLITPNSLASAYVLFELGARWGRNQHMVPILGGLGPEALQGPLKGINCVSANNMAQLHQLLFDLADVLDLKLQAAAGYSRYVQKLIDQVQRTYPALPTQPRIPTHTGGEQRLRALTRDRVIAASKHLKWDKQLPKWTVLIEEVPFPVRPLAFRAAGLLPNDSATTHQAVSVLKKLGFQVFYENQPA